MSTPDPASDPVRSVTLRIPETLDQKVDATAAEVSLSRADVMRLSLDRGMDVLLAQLKGETTTTSPAPAAA